MKRALLVLLLAVACTHPDDRGAVDPGDVEVTGTITTADGSAARASLLGKEVLAFDGDPTAVPDLTGGGLVRVTWKIPDDPARRAGDRLAVLVTSKGTPFRGDRIVVAGTPQSCGEGSAELDLYKKDPALAELAPVKNADGSTTSFAIVCSLPYSSSGALLVPLEARTEDGGRKAVRVWLGYEHLEEDDGLHGRWVKEVTLTPRKLPLLGEPLPP